MTRLDDYLNACAAQDICSPLHCTACDGRAPLTTDDPPRAADDVQHAPGCAVAIAIDAIGRLEKTEWQPIETAPKDGTPILLWTVHQNAAYSKWPVEEGWAGPVIGQWIDFNGGGWTWHGLAGRHTHWMPLPTSPCAPAEPKDECTCGWSGLGFNDPAGRPIRDRDCPEHGAPLSEVT